MYSASGENTIQLRKPQEILKDDNFTKSNLVKATWLFHILIDTVQINGIMKKLPNKELKGKKSKLRFIPLKKGK